MIGIKEVKDVDFPKYTSIVYEEIKKLDDYIKRWEPSIEEAKKRKQNLEDLLNTLEDLNPYSIKI